MKKNRIVVMFRSSPMGSQLPEAISALEEFKALLAKRCPSVELDLVCAVEGALVWLEYWPDESSIKAFYSEYAGFSDLPLRFVLTSRHPPERLHLKEMPQNF